MFYLRFSIQGVKFIEARKIKSDFISPDWRHHVYMAHTACVYMVPDSRQTDILLTEKKLIC